MISDKREEEFDFDHQSIDETGEFRARYEIDDSDVDGKLVLVRPDLYIGMSCLMSEWKVVLEYLSQWYLPAETMVNGRGTYTECT